MKLETLNDLLLNELRDLYSAEGQILKALPTLVASVSSPDLQSAFRDNEEETRSHLRRLDKTFDMLQASPQGVTCKAMKGLIEECKDLLDGDAAPAVLDAALIGAAQRIEHYEIAGYGCARTYARLLGKDDIADLLQLTLDEEEASDRRLTELAETAINAEAAAASH